MDGFLNLHKPAGLTSHDCVARVRRLLKMKRVGHGGTLDPAATGVLPIALGRATRLLQFLRQDKAYRAIARFGITTTTDDLEGDILTQTPAAHLTRDRVEALLPKFLGTIQQVPPAYSAIQVGGQRLYELARAGVSVDVPVRTVTVYQIELLDWRPGDCPEAELAIACGAGTYIRSIARDLGNLLGTGGTLASLIRTHSHGFDLATSLTLEDLAAQVEAGTFVPISAAIALAHLPAIPLPPPDALRWTQGQPIVANPVTDLDAPLRVQDDRDTVLGIGKFRATQQGICLVPWVVLAGQMD
ncbi:tRNA pseudouridine(55) synthase TruB [Thermoleptolyngbya oregonensis NK1-22]|uniref:tRNA pseudouridine synthase B n=1 Tax=Thermoleptolyngbya oregonensis NK1-22 TaxID=2547457 RepID=A0AA96Y6F1_9CYAN|nr:tRNA pseudouridine(55) synthase TruB [Thermoleptolyngbya oregonensis]WOB41858.1 tRNA pseudouridine(55) synthase TruB [Thermoleptolyngbya oregonensis NK1-22]